MSVRRLSRSVLAGKVSGVIPLSRISRHMCIEREMTGRRVRCGGCGER